MVAPLAAPPVAAPDAPPAKARMTFEEYLAFDDEHGRTEWVNGEVICHMSATEVHQRVAEYLLTLLRLFVRLRRLGRVIGDPYVMRATPAGNGREPDVMFIAADHLARLGPQYLDGPADLIVEVVSDDSVARDYDDKFSEYQDAGVREYWIIDPRPKRHRVSFYVLNAQGKFGPVPIADDNRYASVVLPGFWLDVAWLWQDDPDELAALEAIVGAEALPAPLAER